MIQVFSCIETFPHVLFIHPLLYISNAHFNFIKHLYT